MRDEHLSCRGPPRKSAAILTLVIFGTLVIVTSSCFPAALSHPSFDQNRLTAYYSNSWINVSYGAGPGPLWGMGMASTFVNGTNGGDLLYGGVNGTGAISQATWLYTNNGWTQPCDPCAPGARWGATMVYGAGWVLLFGGCDTVPVPGNSCPTSDYLSDAWVWCTYSGWNYYWQRVGNTPQNLGAIMNMSAAAPADYQLAVLFGGIVPGGTPYGGTWGFSEDCSSSGRAQLPGWYQFNPNTSPAARWGAGFVDDLAGIHDLLTFPDTSSYVLYGGRDNSGNVYGDTWGFVPAANGNPGTNCWDAYQCSTPGNWILLNASWQGPGDRVPHLAFYGSNSNLVMWGGGDYYTGAKYTDTWIFNTTNGWGQITTPSSSPVFRLQGMFTYDSGASGNSVGVYLYGGTDDYTTPCSPSVYSDLWHWD